MAAARLDDHAVHRHSIPLIPDAELLRLIDELTETALQTRGRWVDRTNRTRFARQMEAISREIRARGLHNPPWWSVNRDWEIEDLPIGTRAGACPSHT